MIKEIVCYLFSIEFENNSTATNFMLGFFKLWFIVDQEIEHLTKKSIKNKINKDFFSSFSSNKFIKKLNNKIFFINYIMILTSSLLIFNLHPIFTANSVRTRVFEMKHKKHS
jgi:hypothetical protein